jgi:hypothetical protein
MLRNNMLLDLSISSPCPRFSSLLTRPYFVVEQRDILSRALNPTKNGSSGACPFQEREIDLGKAVLLQAASLR